MSHEERGEERNDGERLVPSKLDTLTYSLASTLLCTDKHFHTHPATHMHTHTRRVVTRAVHLTHSSTGGNWLFWPARQNPG